jgi:hypothetical protein
MLGLLTEEVDNLTRARDEAVNLGKHAAEDGLKDLCEKRDDCVDSGMHTET